jgi:uncharacterized membrane protein
MMDKGKKAKVEDEEGSELDTELVMAIEKLQEVQDELERVSLVIRLLFPFLVLLQAIEEKPFFNLVLCLWVNAIGFFVFLAFFARLASLVALKTLVIPRSLASLNRKFCGV